MPKTNFIDLKEIKEINKALRKLPKEFTGKQRKEYLGKAAIPVQEAVMQEVPVSNSVHLGYDSGQTADGKQKMRLYKPGTLKRSIKVMTFKKSSDVFVGPVGRKRTKARKVPGQKLSKARNNLAYYWTFKYYGTRFQKADRFTDRGAKKSKAAAQRILVNEGNKIINRFTKKKFLK